MLPLVGIGLSEITKIPAYQNVYISTDEEHAYNASDVLKCGVTIQSINGTMETIYSGVPLVQFDISNITIGDDEIGILALKAASIKGEKVQPALIGLVPIASDWDENSDYTQLIMNLRPVINISENKDLSQMSISTRVDKVIAFDITNKLAEAKAKGNRASFLLLAVSNDSYNIDFKSRESGEGPYIIIMPYPSSINLDSNQSLNQSLNEDSGQSLNVDLNQSFNNRLNLSENKSIVLPSNISDNAVLRPSLSDSNESIKVDKI